MESQVDICINLDDFWAQTGVQLSHLPSLILSCTMNLVILKKLFLYTLTPQLYCEPYETDTVQYNYYGWCRVWIYHFGSAWVFSFQPRQGKWP